MPLYCGRRRLLRALRALLSGYLGYLLLLGPYLAIIGTGRFDFLPPIVRDAPFYPAAPVYLVPGLRHVYDGYLQFWYFDPNEADSPTGR